jgi:ADP-ribosyl-[dinitrogen reductase] hydrolase
MSGQDFVGRKTLSPQIAYYRPPGYFDSSMHATYLRREHIHGLILGCAIGEALGMPRSGLPRCKALQRFGRPTLKYQRAGGIGYYGCETHLVLMAAQAILKSRSELKYFKPAFQNRLSWYLLSFPPEMDATIRRAASRAWLYRLGRQSGIESRSNSAATRAMFEALAINGAGHRLNRWIEQSTQLTHTHPTTIVSCQLLASLAEVAATTKSPELDAIPTLEQLCNQFRQTELSSDLEQLKAFLWEKRSPRAVARFFGWTAGIPPEIHATTIMASYCWLRNPADYRAAVLSAISLGGDTQSMGAIVGGLVGARITAEKLPPQLVQSLAASPLDRRWIAKLAERLSHWPHGMHDLHSAPAQPSAPGLQILRNLSNGSVLAVQNGVRLLFR